MKILWYHGITCTDIIIILNGLIEGDINTVFVLPFRCHFHM